MIVLVGTLVGTDGYLYGHRWNRADKQPPIFWGKVTVGSLA